MSSHDLLTSSFDPSRAADLAEVLDALPSLVAYVDRDGINRYVNAAAARWLRRPSASIVGHHVRALLTETEYLAVASRIEAAQRGERQEFLRTMPTDTGRVRYVVTEYLPRTTDGVPDGFIAVATDVTARILAERGHESESLRTAELVQRTTEAAQASDDVLQQLYAVGLHLDRLTRRSDQMQGEVATILVSLQETVDRLRDSITDVLLGGGAASTAGVVRQLVAGWASRTGNHPAVVLGDQLDGLDAETARQLLTALSQILATAARHEAGPVRIRVSVAGGRAVAAVDGQEWPMVARSEFRRMSTLVREDGSSLEIDAIPPALTRVSWRSAPPPD